MFLAPNFLVERPPNFWTQFIKLTQAPIMWRSFAVIDPGSSEITRWKKKRRKHHEQNRRPPVLPYGRTNNKSKRQSEILPTSLGFTMLARPIENAYRRLVIWLYSLPFTRATLSVFARATCLVVCLSGRLLQPVLYQNGEISWFLHRLIAPWCRLLARYDSS